jgi:[acyl-carrier-protein] S-malonyltransferase
LPAVFEEADAALGDSSRLCFEGPEEELKQTANTQPAILTHSVAAWRDLQARFPERLEGAASLRGTRSESTRPMSRRGARIADAVLPRRQRGLFMQDAVPEGAGAMAAIVGLAPEEVEAACREASQGEVVSPANFNSPSRRSSPGRRRPSRGLPRPARRGAPNAPFP